MFALLDTDTEKPWTYLHTHLCLCTVCCLLTSCGSSKSYLRMEDMNCRCLFCSSSVTTSCSLSCSRCWAPASSSLNHWFSWHRRRTWGEGNKEREEEVIRKGKCKDKKKGRREDVGRERKKKAMKKVQMANEDVIEGKEGKKDEGDGKQKQRGESGRNGQMAWRRRTGKSRDRKRGQLGMNSWRWRKRQSKRGWRSDRKKKKAVGGFELNFPWPTEKYKKLYVTKMLIKTLSSENTMKDWTVELWSQLSPCMFNFYKTHYTSRKLKKTQFQRTSHQLFTSSAILLFWTFPAETHLSTQLLFLRLQWTQMSRQCHHHLEEWEISSDR